MLQNKDIAAVYCIFIMYIWLHKHFNDQIHMNEKWPKYKSYSVGVHLLLGLIGNLCLFYLSWKVSAAGKCVCECASVLYT